MTDESPNEKEAMPAQRRKPFLERYYAGTIYGKLHIWTYDRVVSNGWFKYEWWDRVSGDILTDMQKDELHWQSYRDFVRENKDARDPETRETCAHLWWTAHNHSLQEARELNDRYFRSMPVAIRERTGLMIEGALAWHVDGLRPWRIPSKWMRIFM